MRYVPIVFMQGNEADDVFNLFGDEWCGLDPDKAIEYLKNWDYGEDDEALARDNPGHGSNDYVEYQGEYILSWNYHLSYVSLTRVIDSEEN